MSIKKNLILFLVFIFIFLFPFFVLAQENDSLLEMADQGNIRTCLHATENNINQNGWKSVNGTLKLTGQCLSKTGCQIWQCNTNNKEIEQDKDIIERCKKKGECGKMSPEEKIKLIEEKIAKSVEVEPGCKNVTSSVVAKNKDNNIFKHTFNLLKNVLAIETQGNGGSVPYGTINTNISGSFIPHVDYTFYAIGEANPVVEETGNGPAEGNDNSQKLSTIEFTFENTEGLKQDCVAISWDPYGRVFDAVSLEPMSDIKITLIDAKTDKPAIQQFEENFDLTDLMGVYNILVEKEGFYKIDVEAPLTHIFTNDLSKLNPAYSKIYSDIYKKNDVYEEKKGIPSHHDIPLVPKGTPYTGAIAEVIEGSLKQVDMGNFVNYSGKVTFPKAKVCLINDETQQLVGQCVFADQYGKFKISLDKKDVPIAPLIIKVDKISLISKKNSNFFQYIVNYLNKTFFKSVLAQQKITIDNINNNSINTNNTKEKVVFNPILNYVEGYAYDNKNKIIPNAKILIRLKMNDKIFYQTIADKSGFFKIDKKNLPFFEYYLEFIDPKTSLKITQTTSQFISNNKTYINQNKINLIEKPVITNNLKPTRIINYDKSNFVNNVDKNNLNKNYSKDNSKLYLTFLILFFLILVFVFVLVYFYLKNKNQQI